MPRKTHADMVEIVAQAVTAAGGEITHETLMERLADHRDVRERLDALVQSGALIAAVTAQPQGAPVLTYRLPGDFLGPSGPAGPSAPAGPGSPQVHPPAPFAG